MKSAYGAVLLCACAITLGYAQQAGNAEDGDAVADFDRRVKAYVALRHEMEKGAAELHETAKPEDIVAAETALAAKIRAARATAKRGDIFTPAIQARFRRLLNPEMQGVRGQNTRGIIRDEGPGPDPFAFSVNGVYPKSQPLGSVPLNILEILPRLPEGLEYRFIRLIDRRNGLRFAR